MQKIAKIVHSILNPSSSLPQLPPGVTSYVTALQYQCQEIKLVQFG